MKREGESDMVKRATRIVGIVVGASSLLAACGSPSSTNADQVAPCDIEKAKELVYGTRDVEVPKDQEAFICDKAKPYFADEETKQRDEENPGEPVAAPQASALYYEEGIYGKDEAGEGPPSDYEYENLWRGVVNEENVAVFAGFEVAKPEHGVIMLQIGDPYTGLHEDKIIDAPIPGPLFVLEAKNPDVVVQSKTTGETAVFDTEMRVWE